MCSHYEADAFFLNPLYTYLRVHCGKLTFIVDLLYPEYQLCKALMEGRAGAHTHTHTELSGCVEPSSTGRRQRQDSNKQKEALQKSCCI